MSILRGALSGLAIIFSIFMMVALIVVGLDAIMPPREQRQSPNEINFRSACAAVKGSAVWNGRHWECLK